MGWLALKFERMIHLVRRRLVRPSGVVRNSAGVWSRSIGGTNREPMLDTSTPASTLIRARWAGVRWGAAAPEGAGGGGEKGAAGPGYPRRGRDGPGGGRVRGVHRDAGAGGEPLADRGP